MCVVGYADQAEGAIWVACETAKYKHRYFRLRSLKYLWYKLNTSRTEGLGMDQVVVQEGAC